uniref:ribonuclease Z n=1 Tax=Romanomermis culicivorax TaxID=13658 RepID=A0A915HM66_ROMCU
MGRGKCIFLCSDWGRYLFNCPESTGRIMRLVPNFKIGRLQDVFITRQTWHNVGGIPGLGLTLKQAGVKKLTVHGFDSVATIFKATNCIYDGVPPVEIVQNHYTVDKFEDESICVKYVPLQGKQKSGNRFHDEKIAAQSSNELTVAYICDLKQRRGKMNIAKCTRMGVPLGPMLGKLQKGESVILADGRHIKPEDVMDDPHPSTCFALVDITDECMLKSLLECDEFDRFSNERKHESDESRSLDLLIHFSNAKIFESSDYIKWMRKFGQSTRHLVLNESSPPFAHNKGIHTLQLQMNHVLPQGFPLLTCHSLSHSNVPQNLNNQIIKAEPFLTYHLRPHTKFARDLELQLINDDVIVAHDPIKSLYEENDDFEKTLNTYKQKAIEAMSVEDDDANLDIQSGDFPEIVFLGTSSAVSTKYRNVSAILARLNNYHSILMDCGEGACQQFYEYFDSNRLDRELTNIKFIFISHLHADHQMGLFSILSRRKEAFEKLNLNYEPVFIVGPADLFKIHFLYSKYIDDVMPLAKRVPSNGEAHLTENSLREIRGRLHLRSLNVVKVMHPKSAYGLIFTTSKGYKVVYSGDTLESTRLINAGRDADLLIHEATLDDSRVADAKTKYHCTIGQAIDVCRKMRAKFSILTHISGRYPTMPLATDEQIEQCGDDMCFAFDFMRFTPKYVEMIFKKLSETSICFFFTIYLQNL